MESEVCSFFFLGNRNIINGQMKGIGPRLISRTLFIAQKEGKRFEVCFEETRVR